MPFSKEDLDALGTFVRDEVSAAVAGMKAELPQAVEQSRESLVGSPDVPHDAGPMFWVHLADGSVIESHDSSSTHIDSVPVIGRYQKGA